MLEENSGHGGAGAGGVKKICKKHVCDRSKVKIFQRGLSEAQNGYGFGMIPGHGLRDVQFSSSVFNSSPA